MHTVQFTYFNVWAQSSLRHALSLASSSLPSAAGCQDTKKIGRKRIPALRQRAELSLIKSPEWIEAQKRRTEKPPDALDSRRFAHITARWFLFPTSDVFWIIVIREDVDSNAACFYPCFDLRRYVNADKGLGQECLIGILPAQLISNLVLLQCQSWTGIFIRKDINLPFQMELKKLLSMFICHLCFLHRALSARWSSPLFLIAHPSPSKGRGGNNVLLND